MHRVSAFVLLGALAAGAACQGTAPAPPSGRDDPAPSRASLPPSAALAPPTAGAERTAPVPATGHGARVGQLARVAPPPAPCLEAHGEPAAPEVLLERAAAALDGREAERALTCADAALELAPRSVAALRGRAAALAALGRSDEARLAYARALAEDPDDPATLRGAADLYALRMSGGTEELRLGLVYAERGSRRALRPPHRDRALAADLHLLAAMAANDLGESRRALEHAGDALRLGAPEADARFERGVALYELCRFREAREALSRVLAVQPQDAWAHHYLALVEERLGDVRRAEALAARARELDPREFPPPVEVSRREFEAGLRRAVDELPDGERRALERVALEVRELPDVADLTAVDPPLSPSILGLYRGPPEGERCPDGEPAPPCRSIVVYRKNLERWARGPEELSEQVKVTLLHELGHFHGESDDQLRARGLE